jgi:hypothetical protein
MNLKNAEGYPDPTAAIAVERVAKTEKPLKGYLPLCMSHLLSREIWRTTHNGLEGIAGS